MNNPERVDIVFALTFTFSNVFFGSLQAKTNEGVDMSKSIVRTFVIDTLYSNKVVDLRKNIIRMAPQSSV